MPDSSPLLVIIGPTASGKTALGIALAQKISGAVVSADSRQVYAGLNIGTAKPPAAWQTEAHDILAPDIVESVPHYLLNIRQPDQRYALPEWQADAYEVIDQLQRNQTPPLLVGGTMLYIDSLRYNYQIPAVPPNEQLRTELAAIPAEDLYKKMIAQDPAAAFIEPHHQQRIIRALEVIAATGQPFSATRQRSAPRYQCRVIGIFPGWEILKKNIAVRAEEMFAAGLVEETQQLRQHYPPSLPLLQTLMYKQASAVLDNRLTLPQAVTEAGAATLRYARRQMAWWKNQTDIEWFAAPDTTTISRSLGIR